MSTQTVLIIDDDKNLCNNLEDILKDNGYEPFSASTGVEGLMLTRTLNPHVVLLDHILPDCEGTVLLSDIKQIAPDCFCIVITAYADIDSAVHAMEKGAFHYLRKPFSPGELLQLLKKIFEIIQLREEKRLTEESLRDSEEKYRTLVNNVNVGVYRNTGGPQGRFIQANPAMVRIFGYDSIEEFMKISVSDLYQDPNERKRYIEKIQTQGSVKDEKLKMKKKDGTPIWASVTATVQYDENGDIKWTDGVVDDITERTHVEDKLRSSEERYRALYEDNPSMYFTVDRNGIVLSVNQFGSEQLGYTVEELMGNPVLNVFHPDDKSFVVQHIAECLQKPGVVFTWELRKVRKNGSIVWVRETVRALRWIDGKIVVFVVCEDINELKKADEALRESEQKYKTLAENSLTGIFIHQDGNYVFVNREFAEMHGYKAEELIGKHYLTLVEPSDKESAKMRVDKRLAGENIIQRYEVKRIKKNGDMFWAEVIVTVIQYRGKPAIMGNMIDISERKQAEKEIIKRVKELEQFYDMAVGRELRIKQLAQDLKELKEELEQYKKQ